MDSSYHINTSNSMNGRRVKHHVIGNGAGDTAATCITIYLTDAEMPGDKDFIMMDIEGLCPGGYGVNGLKEVGHVLLMKSTEGAKKKRFRWIRQNIIFPFIDKIQLVYNNFDASSGAPPSSDEMSCCVV